MKRILIVEDHPDTQSLLCDLLELEGYEVRCSNEAQGVLGLARRYLPDLIVLDVKLPGLSGIELLDLLNQDKQMASVPVLMCSGAMDELEKHSGQIKRSGARVITKPFALDDLITVVQVSLDQGQRALDASA
jgi:DNA-binding response OmpR family regulator